MIITIDGPAGSGKSTAARRLAAALGIPYLDTGATYRAVTYKAMLAGVDLTDPHKLAAVAADMRLELSPQPQGVRVMLDGQDVSLAIRSANVSEKTQYAARFRQVRAVLVDLQRRIGMQLGSFVSEGRDQGSVVFPHADLKFYLDASPAVRARRRYEELTAIGEDVKYEEILQAITDRDGRDRSRAVAPLVKPAGAIEMDTSDMDIEQVTEALRRAVEARR
jgi:cytidylate kinase